MLERIPKGWLEKGFTMRCKCTKCGREYVYGKVTGHTRTVCNSCIVNKYKRSRKLRIIKYLGGKCTKCGYNKCAGVLTVHHIGKKDFNISGSHARKWEAVTKELDKCILLCANCHFELHWNKNTK